MKLQIGSGRARGKYRGRAWINLDIGRFDDVNVMGTGTALPFADGSFDEVHCVHVLEHLPRDQYPIMLAEMNRVLAPDGVAYVEVPDIIATVHHLIVAWRDGDTKLVHNWITSIYGKSEIPGMSHHWGFYKETLTQAFHDVGFRQITRPATLEEMISTHYQQEPVLLIRGVK